MDSSIKWFTRVYRPLLSCGMTSPTTPFSSQGFSAGEQRVKRCLDNLITHDDVKLFLLGCHIIYV
jgi:hypothetical protein